MVHSSGLHALPGSPLGGDRAQATDSPALRGQEPDPDPKRLGEEQRGGRQLESAADVDLKQRIGKHASLHLLGFCITSLMQLYCTPHTRYNFYIFIPCNDIIHSCLASPPQRCGHIYSTYMSSGWMSGLYSSECDQSDNVQTFSRSHDLIWAPVWRKDHSFIIHILSDTSYYGRSYYMSHLPSFEVFFILLEKVF